MCGIFGFISPGRISKNSILALARHAQQRGRDSSGLLFFNGDSYSVIREDKKITDLISRVSSFNDFVFGHSRLATNGTFDNQPVVKDVVVLHNGIVVNESAIWSRIGMKPSTTLDTECIAAFMSKRVASEKDIGTAFEEMMELFQGTISIAVAFPRLGKLSLFSNFGSLYVANVDAGVVFASEEYPLKMLGCNDIRQLCGAHETFDIPVCDDISVNDYGGRKTHLVHSFKNDSAERKLLEYEEVELKRCVRCILPHTMPFIRFDNQGVCNYCHGYIPRNNPKPKAELFDLVEPYRRNNKVECIVPFSGGRDSCYGLHLIINELGLKPITYTYDWGMVTDLGRRNIARMCGKLGVENIIVAADIEKKRRNIRYNLKAWLKSPNLGMMALLTAGDKHFFRHVETVKSQTGVALNLWGVNPLEVTYFKAGFLGIPPDFEEKMVYSNGVLKQLRYHALRTKEMFKSPKYFNRSLIDTLSGEYYRSFRRKSDYFHVFDYWRWDEDIVNNTLIKDYDWELAPDTSTTWRIGDGTAAFYNYVNYTVAGFTEHDTFRSNQIREGQMSRETALRLVREENMPRYPNIKWYLDSIGMPFDEVITRVNEIPKIYLNFK